MADVDPVARSVDCRVVYAGAPGTGKTANLEYLHQALDPDDRGQLISPAPGSGRSFSFDFLSVDLGAVGGWRIRLHLFAAPSGEHHSEDRVRILQGADAMVVVVDSDPDRLDEHRRALERLDADLERAGVDRGSLITAVQYNKRDLEAAAPVPELEEALNPEGAPHFEAVARRGDGVVETLEEVGYRVVRNLEPGRAGGSP